MRELAGTYAPETVAACLRDSAARLPAGRIAGLPAAVRVPLHPRAPAAQVLAEARVPLEGAFPKPLTDEVVQAADIVITMGCGDACPVLPGRRYLDWDLPDPAGTDEATVRQVAARIAALVQDLLADLDRKDAG